MGEFIGLDETDVEREPEAWRRGWTAG